MPLRSVVSLILLVLSACARAQYIAPSPAAPRRPVDVAASSAASWKAVIEVLSRDSTRIVSMDTATGFISAVRTLLPSSTDEEKERGRQYADCGRTPAASERPAPDAPGDVLFHPVSASYSITVRVSGGSSTLRTSARYLGRSDRDANGPLVLCASTGRFESELEAAVKARAEGVR